MQEKLKYITIKNMF